MGLAHTCENRFAEIMKNEVTLLQLFLNKSYLQISNSSTSVFSETGTYLKINTLLEEKTINGKQ